MMVIGEERITTRIRVLYIPLGNRDVGSSNLMMEDILEKVVKRVDIMEDYLM